MRYFYPSGQIAHQLKEDKRMTNQEYNGWYNRETWATALHINNDQALQELAQDYALTALNEHANDSSDKESNISSAIYCLEDTLQNWICEDLLTLENVTGNQALFNMLTDIGSLYRVNWSEIADSFISELVSA